MKSNSVSRKIYENIILILLQFFLFAGISYICKPSFYKRYEPFAAKEMNQLNGELASNQFKGGNRSIVGPAFMDRFE